MKKTIERRTRPNYAQREYWNECTFARGVKQDWADGFISGIITFTRFLNHRRAIITFTLPKKQNTKKK